MDRHTEVLRVSAPAERAQAYDVRTRVFVHEQGVPTELELDELDEKADHFLARLDDRPVGAGRMIVRDGATGVLGRLAVLAEARGTGLGVALVRAIEDRARELGLTAIELHAQTHATGFYERLGYTSYGPEELDAGIPHIWMRRAL
ncbi:GNAT family N-acetyltransferase [Actinomadura craniellae]|uniref:GNAT family N-acetyltransferase n=1 Tax=Actinomadura craniellae TaxID=2231787 RepID=A0A365HBX1_9ACTN|nr:GNAT family N-acetyltransferase [Actinomadura craniellae]RAY16512.1 GNAT family N-acetyltransferase [Actinomadura craniellae]